MLPNCAANATLDDVLSQANVVKDEYLQALEVTNSGTVVLLKRTPSEQNVNNYNPSVMLAWQANMDIQYVLNAYVCVMYVASYIMKTEKSMGALLKQIAAEARTDELKLQLRKIGSAFLTNREVSAQETVYRLLSIPLKQLSRAVIFVDTNIKKDRIAVLKGPDDLSKLHGEDTNVFQKSLIDRYEHRPAQLSDMCLAEFAATYSTDYRPQADDVNNDALDVESETNTNKIRLTGGFGFMRERRRPATIRFRRYNIHSDPSNWYRAKLMLYYPWYNEEVDLLAGHSTYAEHYNAVRTFVASNESKYTIENIDDIDVDENSRPEHAWCQIAPSTEHSNTNAAQQGSETITDISPDDLVDNDRLLQSNPTSGSAPTLSARFESAANHKVIPPTEYRTLMRSLNTKQKQIVVYHRNWCKRAVIDLKDGKRIEPYYIFLSGPGGVGKSHVIKLIQSDTLKLIRLSGTTEPDDVLVLLTAPNERVNTLRSKLSKLVLLIIDEVSMVGANMLLEIHKRLQQIKAVAPDLMFGGVSVLAVGNLYQLPPVGQPTLFSRVRDCYAQLYGSSSVWQDQFKLVELDEIMRQRGDSAFAKLLCRARTASCTAVDISVLKSRIVHSNSVDYPTQALHVYRLNEDVDIRNKYMLSCLPASDPRCKIKATDAATGQTKHIDLGSLSSKRTDTGGLHSVQSCSNLQHTHTYYKQRF